MHLPSDIVFIIISKFFFSGHKVIVPILFLSCTGCFMSTYMNLSRGTASFPSACRHFLSSWLVWEDSAPCSWCHTWTGGLGLYKTANQGSRSEQAREQHSSLVSASVSASIFWLELLLRLPLVMDCDCQAHKSFPPPGCCPSWSLSRQQNRSQSTSHCLVFESGIIVLCYNLDGISLDISVVKLCTEMTYS